MNSPATTSPAILRLSSIVAGLVLTILLAGWLVPFIQFSSASQFDFWLVWLLCMLILALPFTLLEIALAKRSKLAPLPALMVLTRESDSKPIWRLTSWLSAGTLALLGGGLLYQSASMSFGGMDASVSNSTPAMSYLPFATLIAGVVLSFVQRNILLLVASVAVIAAVIISFLNVGSGTWQWTDFDLHEWGWAVTLALMTTGLGLGIYWQLNTFNTQERASQSALPIWLAQVVGGVIIALTQGFHGKVALCLYSVALLAIGAFVIALLREQLKARGLNVLLQWALIAAGLLVWLIPAQNILVLVTVILGLLTSLAYALFGGWQMKISHLRKSLNFSQEAVYNLWRIALRIIIPLAVVLAIIGLLLPA